MQICNIKLIWIFLFTLLAACSSNTLKVETKNIPKITNKNLSILIKADDEQIIKKVKKTISRIMKKKKINPSYTTNPNNSRIDVTLEKGVTQWTAYTNGYIRYYTDIHQIEVHIDMFNPGKSKPYITIGLFFDSKVKGASKEKRTFKEKESLDSLIIRVARFIATIYLSISQDQKTGIEGLWTDAIGYSSIIIKKNKSKTGYIGVTKTLQYGNIGFSKNEEAYKMGLVKNTNGKKYYRGYFKVKYLDGRTKWFSTNFYLYGCLLVVDPTEFNSSAGQLFLTGQCS